MKLTYGQNWVSLTEVNMDAMAAQNVSLPLASTCKCTWQLLCVLILHQHACCCRMEGLGMVGRH